jgi:hypothetical protein
MEEVPLEDKCFSSMTHYEGTNIFVINHAAGRVLRQELFLQLANSIEALK